MMILRALALPLSGLLTIIGLSWFGTSSAQAAVYLQVCNSGASVTGIRPYDRFQGWYSGRTLLAGDCWSFYNGADEVRIDIDAANLGVGSWKWGLDSSGYGACKEYYAGQQANPADSWNGHVLWIRNYWGYHC
jgi:hypothetical protein